MIELRFRGEESRDLGEEPTGGTFPGVVTVKAAGRVDGTRGSGRVLSHPAAPDDVLELTLEDGLRWFVSAEQLQDDLAEDAAGQGSANSLEVPSQLFSGTGRSGLAVHSLRLLSVEVAAGATVQSVAEAIERRLKPGPGVYHCTQLDSLGAKVDERAPLSAGSPILVLLHGTGSNSQGSFGGFPTGESEAWSLLRHYYLDRIVAFEHRSLSQSPIDNALELAAAIPKNAEIHLLSHSRGGLVGELLCGGWRVDDLTKRLFQNRAGQLDSLTKLEVLLAAKHFNISRFVRVACPARGTTLASRRLDRFASLLLNAFSLLPHAAEQPAYQVLKAFALAAAKLRLDPQQLPGLEAMMPDAPLIRLLNGAAGATEADLTVIAGDFAGEGLASRLKELATNLFFCENHDLVVNTSAMTGGVPRSRGGRYFFAQGPEVDHFHYFSHSSPALPRILWGLTWKEGTSSGLEPIVETTSQDLISRASRYRRGQGGRVVILLPAPLCTHLGILDQPIWLNPRALAHGGLDLLRLESTAVRLMGASEGLYGDLVEHLSQRFEVEIFPYDWRLSPANEAKRLAKVLRARLADPDVGSISLLAHLSGGAVVRRMIAANRRLWERVRNSGGRLVQLGLPQRAALPARERLLELLAILDLRHTKEEIARLLDGFPGLQPTPEEVCRFEPEFMSCVAGHDDAATGGWADCQPWLVDAAPGDLASLRKAFPGYSDLLLAGTTATLQRASSSSEAAGNTPSVPAGAGHEPGVEAFPNAADLAAAALGGTSRNPAIEAAPPPLEVVVAHGNLAFAPDAVLIGHYDFDVLASAELFLDRHFSGRLSERRLLGLYPGPVGTVEVIFHPAGDHRPPAGLIVGLGPVGDLSASKLEEGVALALLELAIKSLERSTAATDVMPLRVSSLLIGTGDNMLSVEASVAAIVSGALCARERLAKSSRGRQVRLEKLTFVELYLDRAIQAAQAVDTLRARERFHRTIHTSGCLERLDGGRHRTYYEEDPSWWSRLKIERTPGHEAAVELRFTTLTERARAEETPITIDTRMVDPVIAAAIEGKSRDSEVSGTLFELLVPNRLKDLAPIRRDQVLILDEAAAAYPWELVHDLLRGDKEPLAVRAGVIRQLTGSDMRELPRPALGNSALVVGDPISKSFHSLRGAQEEAKRVGHLLAGRLGSEVISRIRASSPTIVQDLFARPYRILHLSGHGVYRWDPSAKADCAACSQDCRCVTGMVLGDDVFLTTATVEQLRYVPDLVFLNCCFLGKVEPGRAADHRERPRLAANLAAQFIRMGCRAVIAAGWKVDDAAALAFAERFYEGMIGGEPFGRSVHAARAMVHRCFPRTNTWGAYQCYGDPGWVLHSNGPRHRSARPCFAIDEAIADLGNLREEARIASAKELAEIAEEITRIEDRSRDRGWLEEASILAALGSAWGEIGAFERAIDRYSAALQAERGEASIATAEQLANLRSRLAFAEFLASPRDKRAGIRQAARERIEQSIRELQALPHGPRSSERSSERWRLLGSCYKRRSALCESRDERRKDLEETLRCYRAAETTQRKVSPEQEGSYGTLNALVAEVLLSKVFGHPLPDRLLQRVQEAMRGAGEELRRSPTFWQAVARSDGQLVQRLAGNESPTDLADIIAGYVDASRLGSPREIGSILDHLDWIAEILLPEKGDAVKNPAKNEQERLHRSVVRIGLGVRAGLTQPV